MRYERRTKITERREMRHTKNELTEAIKILEEVKNAPRHSSEEIKNAQRILEAEELKRVVNKGYALHLNNQLSIELDKMEYRIKKSLIWIALANLATSISIMAILILLL